MQITVTEHEKPKAFTPFTLSIRFDTEEEYAAFYVQMNLNTEAHDTESFEQAAQTCVEDGLPELTAVQIDLINKELFFKLPYANN